MREHTSSEGESCCTKDLAIDSWECWSSDRCRNDDLEEKDEAKTKGA